MIFQIHRKYDLKNPAIFIQARIFRKPNPFPSPTVTGRTLYILFTGHLTVLLAIYLRPCGLNKRLPCVTSCRVSHKRIPPGLLKYWLIFADDIGFTNPTRIIIG